MQNSVEEKKKTGAKTSKAKKSESSTAKAKQRPKKKKKDSIKKSSQHNASKKTGSHENGNEVFFVLGLGFSAFLIISLHTNWTGALGAFFRSLFLGLFSNVGFIFPYIFLLLSFALFVPKCEPYRKRIYISLVSVFLFASVFQGMFHLKDLHPVFWDGEYLKNAYESGIQLSGNGAFGVFLISMLYRPIGMAGLVIILILAILCIFIFAFYIKPSEVVEKYGKKAIHTTKRTIQDAREMALKSGNDDATSADQKGASDSHASVKYNTGAILDEINKDYLFEQKLKDVNREFEDVLHKTQFSSYEEDFEELTIRNYEDGYDSHRIDAGEFESYPVQRVAPAKREEECSLVSQGEQPQPEQPQLEQPQPEQPQEQRMETALEAQAVQTLQDPIEERQSEDPSSVTMSDDVRTFEPAVEALENSEIMIGEMTPEEFEVYEPMDEPADVQPDESVSQFSDGSSNVPSPNFQFDLPKHSVEIAQPVAQPDYFGSMKGSTDAIEVNSTVSEELRDEDYEREFDFENEKKLKFLYENYQLPNLDLLKEGKKSSNKDDEAEILSNVNKLRQTFQNFRIDAKITQVSKGPMITRFEIQPNAGVKVSKIVGLSDDIALNLAATSVRIVAPIPGKSAIGIEIPNKSTSVVSIKDVVSTPKYEKESSLLKFGLGLDISGEPIVADLAKMPHLLIAGATGSGKSVCVNTIIASILLNAKPDEVKFLMIDPKVVELNVYNGIAHLILPVVTDPKKASLALNWAVNEMTQRYTKFAKAGVKDINGYNKKFELEENAEYMPRIVVIIDELSDLMMAAPNQVEEAICRLAQMARACGIHLIVATQRPSVDVITGVIKANIPSRIAFAVSSQIDSRTIIDGSGAEKLLGKGDMLYYPSGMPKPIRVQGSFISEEEVEKIVEFISAQSEGIDIYDQDVLESAASSEPEHEEVDELLSDAIDFVVEAQKASTSLIQRKFRIGYNRAARMMEALEERGIVGPSRGSKPREVLIKSLD